MKSETPRIKMDDFADYVIKYHDLQRYTIPIYEICVHPVVKYSDITVRKYNRFRRKEPINKNVRIKLNLHQQYE
jgi:hypothetical protein